MTFDTKTAALYLGLSEHSIGRLVYDGRLKTRNRVPGTRMGPKTWIFDIEELDKYKNASKELKGWRAHKEATWKNK